MRARLGLRLTAAAGLVGVFVLLAVIAVASAPSAAGCFAHATLLVVGYAGDRAVRAGAGSGLARPGRGLGRWPAAALLGAYLARCSTPGVHTPRAPSAGRRALEAGTPPRTRTPARPRWSSSSRPSRAGSAADAVGLAARLPRAPALHAAAAALAAAVPPDAPVRITEFTDVRCSHCAELHHAWTDLREALPAGQLQRGVAPLPARRPAATRAMQRAAQRDPVRCLAPRGADLPREATRSACELTGALFAEQQDAHARARVRAGRRRMPRAALEACVASPRRSAKLERRRRRSRPVQPGRHAPGAGERAPGHEPSRRSCTRWC